MKEYIKQYLYIATIVLSSSVLTMALAAAYVQIEIIQPFKKEAVDRGFASWEVTNNATGKTKFVWNEFAQALHPENPANLFAQIEESLPEVK